MSNEQDVGLVTKATPARPSREFGLRRVSLTHQAAQAIIDLILSERLQPGDALPSSFDLADRLDVSRTVVREALADLAGRGVVARPGGRETIVAAPGAAQLRDVFGFRLRSDVVDNKVLMEFRLLVETSGARLAAERITEPQLQALAQALDKMRAATDEPAFTAGDIEFHQVLSEASGNLLLQLLIESLGDLFADFRSRSYLSVERRGVGFDRTIEEHEQILEALRRRNSSAAAKAMAEHILAVARLLDVEVSRAVLD